MNTVTSRDGTTIAYDRAGQGPVVILVTGALGTRSHLAEGSLACLLAQNFTAIDYDRRGRGDSTDTAPYSVEREIEDIEALIDAAGGSAYLYGMSSGAVLALEAAAQLSGKVTKLALYEPPLILDDSRPPIPADYVQRLNTAIAENDRGKAVEIFMTKALLIPDEFVSYMRNPPTEAAFPESEGAQPPQWSDMEKVAHTLAYDGIIVQDVTQGKPLPPQKWDSAKSKTVIIVGENSEPFFHDGAKTLANALLNANYQTLAGQDHAVAPAALAPILTEFFSA